MEGDPQNWREGLSEDIRSHPSLEPYKLGEGEEMVSVPPGLVKSYIGQQTLIGRDKIPVPPENATDEDWNEVFSRLGRPDAPEGYELKPPDGLPEQVKVSDELITEYKGVAHKLGFSPKQAQELLSWYLGANGKEIEALDNQRKEFQGQTEAALRKEWGQAYEQKVTVSANTFQHLAGQLGKEKSEQLMNLMEDTGLGDHPLLIGLFAKVAELIGEDVIAGKPAAGFGILTPEQAKAEIAKIYGDEKHPYHHPNHAEHKMAVQRMDELTKMEVGEEG